MTKVIGVRFRNVGKLYYFDPRDLDIKKGDRVIVETARGVECGDVGLGIHDVADDAIVSPLKPVKRKATDDDIQKYEANREKEKEAYSICRQKIEAHGLDMKLVDVEYAFDDQKILFYFTADGRVDFRELVKDLASVFRTRIELRQIGVRDESKILGGVGICGKPFCCSSFLFEFQPVSIKMAKEQGKSLNPTKISGTCGRLMCCLKYEQEVYEELSKLIPRNGTQVKTVDGTGVVIDSNVLASTVKVRIGEGADTVVRSFDVADIHILSSGRPQQGSKPQTGKQQGSKSQENKQNNPKSGGRKGGGKKKRESAPKNES